MVTSTEENYLKAIHNLRQNRRQGKDLGTNELATQLGIAPATVSNMLKKLKDKNLIEYEKYGGISLLELGREIANAVIRKHRLWETFLVEKLEFTWDEIHEVAEQLEHIKSKKLVDQLDKLLDYPDYDPHGDPIPKPNGEMCEMHNETLDEGVIGKSLVIVGVKNDSSDFLQHLSKLGLKIKSKVVIEARYEFDNSLEIEIDGRNQMISQIVAQNICVI